MIEAAIIIFITVTLLGVVFWLFWRRTRLGKHAKNSEHIPITSDGIVNKTNVVIFKVELPPESPSKDQGLEVGEETSVEGAKEQSEKEQLIALQEGSSTQTKMEPNVSGQENAEPFLSGKSDYAKLISDDQSGLHERFPPTNSVPISGNSGHYLPQKPTASTTEVTPTPAGNLQTEDVASVTEIALPAVESPDAKISQTVAGSNSEHTPPIQHTQQSVDKETKKAPQRYRPPQQKHPRQETTRPVNQKSPRAISSEAVLEIRVRLTFDRFGFCNIGLLPERRPELDNEITVKHEGVSLRLMAQEDWYQDLTFQNIGGYLWQGLELKGHLADHRAARWLLRGRDLYVLASHQRASGFVSTNRLVLGRSHVVLCRVELLQEVETILNVAGCQGYTKLEATHGVPPGWIGLRDVSPAKAILDLGSDPFYAIKPAPDIEIELEGGVCLRNSVWLAGYPPRIKLFGQSNGAVKVLIDGKEAQYTEEGSLVVAGYDLPGQQHSIYCEGLSCSRSYSIEEPPDSWEEWSAYRFGEAEICGPLVRLSPLAASRRVITVPMSNPLLLGAEPGQIFRCSSRNVGYWKGFVPFDVVWALPAYPLRCDKNSARILQISNTPFAPPKIRTKQALDWCNAILDASRKGLRVDKNLPESTKCWSEYKKEARKIWRAAR